MGQSGLPIDPDAVAVSFEGEPVAEGGVEVDFDRPALRARLAGDFLVEVKVGEGPGRARIIAADLTPGYVEFNGTPS
jgi:N-acetylglutamate synthase/N-acetylornithine aminotransferase